MCVSVPPPSLCMIHCRYFLPVSHRGDFVLEKPETILIIKGLHCVLFRMKPIINRLISDSVPQRDSGCSQSSRELHVTEHLPAASSTGLLHSVNPHQLKFKEIHE